MLSLSILFALLACAEPDTDDDTGPPGPTDGGATSDGGGTTADGGTSAAELCREVETPFDEMSAPVSSGVLWNWTGDIQASGAAAWTASLDGSELSEVDVGGQWTGDFAIVDWVADGSPEAVLPCMTGPATRVKLVFNVSVLPDSGQGAMAGAMDANPEGYWLTRVRTTDPELSSEWRALVDEAEEGAGHPDATTFMALEKEPGEPVLLTIGSETATWSRSWWSGPLIEYGRIPSSLALD